MPSYSPYLILSVIVSKCVTSDNPTNNGTVAIIAEQMQPTLEDSPSNIAFTHWQHGMLMFMAFGVILPISMMFFYFGAACSISISTDKRKRIHYIGFMLAFFICFLSILFELFILNGIAFNTKHGMFGMALFCLMFVSIIIFCMMRIFKYGLQIWFDFFLSFTLFCWSFYEMVNGLLLKNNGIEFSKFYVYGLLTWFSMLIVTFVTFAIYIYLTTGISMVVVQAFGEKEADPSADA
eukprot:UN03869